MRPFATAVFVVLLALSAPAADRYALRGTVVTPNEVMANGVVVIEGGKIIAVGSNALLTEDLRVVDTEGFIFPGLIDLHNHVVWNAFVRFSLDRPTGNRYDWQALQSYADALQTPQAELRKAGRNCDLNAFGEVKALVGGVTSITGSFPDPCIRGLARNLDFASGFYGNDMNDERVYYEVFPLGLTPDRAQTIRTGMKGGKRFVVHLSEGVDSSARREARFFGGQQLAVPGAVIIHGVALVEQDFADLKTQAVSGFVWSPRSNIELYGKTADVRTVKRYLPMAIAPDWAPSGSTGMIEELEYAEEWNDSQSPRIFTARELVQMASVNAAKIAGIDDKVGSIAPGLYADLLVVAPQPDRDAYESLIYAGVEGVRLVIVNGRPIYGDAALMKAVNPSAKPEQVSICSLDKAVDMSDAFNGGGTSFASTVATLKDAFAKLPKPVPMAGLAECP